MFYLAIAQVQWTIVVFNSPYGVDTHSLSHLDKLASKKK